MIKNIYILSTGRSGTNFISKLFAQYGEDLEITHQKKGSRLINIIANLPMNTTKLLWLLFKIFKRRDTSSPESSADPLISSALYLLLKNRYFNGKIIHLVREPQSFADSVIRWKNQSLKKKFLHHFIPFWNPNPFLFDSRISLLKLIRMNKYDKYCWIWSYKNQNFYSLKNLTDIEYMLIKIEDLTNINLEIRIRELKKISEFIGHSWDDKIVKNINFAKVNESKKSKKSKNSFTQEQKNRSLKLYCQDSAVKFGYKIK